MQNRLKNESEDDRKKRLAQLALSLSKWFTKWGNVFQTHEVTQLQILSYVEALDDLTPEEVEIGCREAGRTAEQFPKPGHIRKALLSSEKPEKPPAMPLLGPPLDWNPALERERIERQKLFKYSLTMGGETSKEKESVLGQPKRIAYPPKSLEQQKEELRGKGWIQ